MFGLGVNRLGFTANQKLFSPASLFNNGEAGVWYDPSAASGSLDWRKNLLEYTESFDNTIGWAKGINTVITPNASTYNGSSASRVQMPASAGTYVMAPVQLIEGVKYTFSIYLKNNGSPDLNVGVGTSVNSGITEGVNYTVTNEWVRYVYVYTAATSSQYWFGVDNRSNSTAVDVYAWGAQVEEASTASSYQPILSTFKSAFKAANPNHTLYQDSLGVTPVTAVGEPVGLMLDKSKGLAQGPELVTNGDFATDSDWTKGANWSISGGKATCTGGSSQFLYQSSSTASIDDRISVKITVSDYTSGTLYLSFSNGSEDVTTAMTAAGTYIFYGMLSVNERWYIKGTNFVGSIDNVSVKEIQGSHATQPTSAKRPIYARHPEGGIRNLLNYTEQFDNSAWIKTSMSVVANQTTAPDGTQTADKFTPVGSGIHLFGLNQSIGAGNNTASVYMKKGTGRYGGIRLVNDAFGNDRYSVLIDLETGSFVSDYSTGNPPVKAYKIDDSGNGWYRLSVMLQHSTSTMNVSVFTNNDNTPAWAATALPEYTANGTDYIYAWGAQLEEATEASNYQKVVTDIDVTESGVGEVYYLKFDGTDDGMSINNLTSGNTPLTALFGYSAEDCTAIDFLFDTISGRTIFGIEVGKIRYYDGAWLDFNADGKAIKVLTYDLVEDNAKIRIDGTQEYSDTTYDQRGINGATALFAGYDVNHAFVKGNMYQTILRAAESTDEEIAKAETYVANKTGLKAQVDGIATLDLNFGANTYTAKNSNGGVI